MRRARAESAPFVNAEHSIGATLREILSGRIFFLGFGFTVGSRFDVVLTVGVGKEDFGLLLGHGGSGLGRSHDELAELEPKAVLLEPHDVYGWHGVRDLESVGAWLKRIGLAR